MNAGAMIYLAGISTNIFEGAKIAKETVKAAWLVKIYLEHREPASHAARLFKII